MIDLKNSLTPAEERFSDRYFTGHTCWFGREQIL
jgi:hypothetical protein